METKRRNTRSTRNLRHIVGAVLIGVMVGAAQAAEAKDGGKGGGDKGGGGDNQGYTQYLRELATFDNKDAPRGMGRHDDTLARPGFFKEREDFVRSACYTMYQYYDWIHGTYVTTYSGRQRNCGVN